MAHEKLILFIDVQNFYNGARRAFFSPSEPHFYGQIKPMELGNLICSRPAPDIMPELRQVRLYTGRPDSTKNPKTYAAHMKQCDAWVKAGAKVIARALRYPEDWPASRPEQKGVDVVLAIDFVALAVDGAYDIGVIASSDTDLIPALEFVNRRFKERFRTEVVAWTSPQTKSRLSIPGESIWCHWLDITDYNTSLADLTDYNI